MFAITLFTSLLIPFAHGYTNTCFSTVYINLAHRTDRKHDMERELHRIGLRHSRIEAETYQGSGISRQVRGAIGCGLSHIKALQKTNDTVLVLEDDVHFLQKFPPEICDTTSTHPWDVILLGYNTRENCKSRFCRTKNSQTTSGYVVKREYKSRLISSFSEAVEGLKRGGQPSIYAIDQYWKQLQKEHRWYFMTPRIIKQKKSFSDIEGSVVNYGV